MAWHKAELGSKRWIHTTTHYTQLLSHMTE
jgi:hypothetical protein